MHKERGTAPPLFYHHYLFSKLKITLLNNE